MIINLLAAAAISVTFVGVLFMGGYSLAQLHYMLIRFRLRNTPPPKALAPATYPRITVQLPLYNEAAVAERLIRCISELRWPREYFQIQVLDDSTDATSEILAAEVERCRAEGIDIQHVQRDSREGFKAGALKNGLETASGELIAIFDADFLPKPDFLERAYAHMPPNIGLVQARWGHLNRTHSVTTRAQALHLDTHFALEQYSRHRGGLFMGFNGTAGVWRREAIAAAGGWQVDTLTEDLDIAIRAQLAGWDLCYVDEIESPAELPESMPAIRSQQHRWMKGGAQVARKLLGTVWRAPIPLKLKLQATAHLGSACIWPVILAGVVMGPILVRIYAEVPWAATVILPIVAVFQCVVVTLILSYLTTSIVRTGSVAAGLRRAATEIPLLLTFSVAISVQNAVAVFEGFFGETGTFVRTPKTGDQRPNVASNISRRFSAAPLVTLAELGFVAWAFVGIGWSISAGNYAGMPWFFSQAFGFALIHKL